MTRMPAANAAAAAATAAAPATAAAAKGACSMQRARAVRLMPNSLSSSS